MKKIILSAAMCVLTTASFAQNGTCGENLAWTLSSGTLTISGTGTMTGYSMDGTPWTAQKAAITKVVVEGAENIGSSAFYWLPNLTVASISESVTAIGTGAFGACQKLPSIIIPNSVTTIGIGAFSWCSVLNSVTLGNKVAAIGNEAFAGCDALRTVISLNPAPPNANGAFGSVGNITLYVPAESVDTYKEASVWKDFKEIRPYAATAIETPAAESAIGIYPNPVTESFRISGLSLPAQVIISDISGKTVWKQTVESGGNIPAGSLPQGVYLVRANGKAIKIIKK
jgi:hypothetical protein